MGKKIYSKKFATIERREMLDRYGVNYMVNSNLQFIFINNADSKKASRIFSIMFNS